MTDSVEVHIMSGVEDGRVIALNPGDGDGAMDDKGWSIRLGRREDNDIWLRFDSFASRYHARVHQRSGRWWLEDCASKNGTFVELGLDEARVSGTIPLERDQLFRVGRTWFRVVESGSGS